MINHSNWPSSLQVPLHRARPSGDAASAQRRPPSCTADLRAHSLALAAPLIVATVLLLAVFANARNDSALATHCERFYAFEPGIAEDLLPWYDDDGISEALMDRVLRERTMSARVPGLPLCIRNGVLYVINGSVQSIANVWPWQAENIVVYAHALSRLVARWGPALPDVEFVIETADTPFQDLGPPKTPTGTSQKDPDAPGGVWGTPHGRMPIMRHCKTAVSPDITIPIFHFYTVHYDDTLLASVDRLNTELPWEARLPQAFAAGVTYHREQNTHSTVKHWDGANRGEQVRMVREAFSKYLDSELQHPNINYSALRVPLEDWARYKMVMHVDGITCSSRVWQMLALGSVVLREQSGYFAFHDKLLSKFHHYVPFWSNRPREVVWAYNWVMANDEDARAIAHRGQQFARTYLNRHGIECYWALLLRQYARLLRFKPGERSYGGGGGGGSDGGGAGGQLELMPVAEWLASQDGKVSGWPPNKSLDIVNNLNLLPPEP